MLDLASMECDILSGATDAKRVRGLDGLIFHGKSLTGIYNLEDRSQHAVLQYQLAADGKSVVKEIVVDLGNKHFYEPTTLAIYHRRLHVIANSHLGFFNENKSSTSGIEDKLTAPLILIYKLKH